LYIIRRIQNQCLRRIAGAYKRTPTAAVERETAVPPLDLYIDTMAMQRAIKIEHHQVSMEIKERLDEIWAYEKRRAVETPAGRRRPARYQRRPDTGMERLKRRTSDREKEVSDHLIRTAHESRGQRERPNRMGGHQHQWKEVTLISRGLDIAWKERWTETAQGKTATTWRTPWTQPVLRLYENLRKHEATALFLLRTEVIGLNAWLAQKGVPDVLPRCQCEYQAQTVRHVILYCPLLVHLRAEMIEAARSEDLTEILTSQHGSQAAVRMLLRSGLLGQFRLANEISEDNFAPTGPLQDLDSWT